MKSYYFLLLLVFLSACTLSADQESALHNAMISYVNAKNEGIATAYVAYTHPNAVAYYKEKGDSVFQMRYDLSMSETSTFLQDGTIQEIQTEGNRLHVKYIFREIRLLDFDERAVDRFIIAVSEDDGKSWFFIDEEDYFNDDIIDRKNRLFK